ncbi:MAG: CopD family protein [Candidatus Thorarchaeota archaeon]|nr:CopD family protein [Candidatus Thorarchaeota archaeon]
MANILLLTLVSFLHDLFTAIWIGGMITLGLTVLPTTRKVLGKSPETQKLADAIRERLSKVTYVAFIVLIATGVLMSNSSPLFEGFFTFTNEYSTLLAVKHIIVAVMIIIAILRSIVVPKMNMPGPKRLKLMMVLLFTNIILGCGIIFISGYLSAAVRISLLPAH